MSFKSPDDARKANCERKPQRDDDSVTLSAQERQQVRERIESAIDKWKGVPLKVSVPNDKPFLKELQGELGSSNWLTNIKRDKNEFGDWETVLILSQP